MKEELKVELGERTLDDLTSNIENEEGKLVSFFPQDKEEEFNSIICELREFNIEHIPPVQRILKGYQEFILSTPKIVSQLKTINGLVREMRLMVVGKK